MVNDTHRTQWCRRSYLFQVWCKIIEKKSTRREVLGTRKIRRRWHVLTRNHRRNEHKKLHRADRVKGFLGSHFYIATFGRDAQMLFVISAFACRRRASWILFHDYDTKVQGNSPVPLDRIDEITIMSRCIPRCSCSEDFFLLPKMYLFHFYLFKIQTGNWLI